MPVKEQVVLVHGLWMHGMVMAWMARRIEHHGYTVHCYSYPTVRLNLAENASRLAAFCDSLGARPLHLVGHSLGGLLIARMLDEPHQLDIGRVVFLGSPYTGSFAARRFSSVPMGRAAVGASIAEWLRGARPGNLAKFEVGAIAGDLGVGLGVMVVPDLPRPHDGTVCVAETEVPGARDHIVLPVSHTGMVMSMRVVRQVCEFLRRGKFARGARA
jgi:pimeloyl-ACP methyl ester carboxylesterase